MTEAGMLARIEGLEARIAHQERAIEDLNSTVTAQWKQIDALTRRMERMADQLRRVEDGARPGEDEPPPPHY